jgi:Glyoxalase/Bleomycin resistance protein/Dioxygenase superfamily
VHAAQFILYVADQARARDFYRHVLAAEPVLDVPGMTEFDLGGATLGLMPASDMEALASSIFAAAMPRPRWPAPRTAAAGCLTPCGTDRGASVPVTCWTLTVTSWPWRQPPRRTKVSPLVHPQGKQRTLRASPYAVWIVNVCPGSRPRAGQVL